VSIRARLLTGMVALVCAGLVVAAVSTYEEQRSFLMGRVSQQVQAAIAPVAFRLGGAAALGLRVGRLSGRFAPAASRGSAPSAAGSSTSTGGRPSSQATQADLLVRSARRALRSLPGARPRAALPPGTFGALVSRTGSVLSLRVFGYGTQALGEPRLPAHPPLSRPGAPLRLFTIRASNGSAWRAVAFTLGADTAIAAVPLTEVETTLARLVHVELMVGLGVIGALVVLGWLVIRVGLRPLDRIGRVAREIAAGDLSRRVAPADGRTEAGRLGASLNQMLAQIERAFADRRASEERMRQFIADASHELRTPLQVIRGYAELFRMGAAGERETIERAMARIESEAARMGTLVDDLLALAELERPPGRPASEVDLSRLADQAVQDARVLDGEREMAADLADAAFVLGDPLRLRQMVDNLLRNALGHTPPGTPVEVSVGLTDDGRVRLSVRDHGPGLPPGAGERVFERFWRAERGRARGPGGAGLGLAIVRAVAIAHGGEVRAIDAPGGGALFEVLLPAAPRRPPRDPTAEPQTDARLSCAPPRDDDSQRTLSPLSTASYPRAPQCSADQVENRANETHRA